jgi:hypothetical protein
VVAGSFMTRPVLFYLPHVVKRGAQSQAGAAEGSHISEPRHAVNCISGAAAHSMQRHNSKHMAVRW